MRAFITKIIVFAIFSVVLSITCIKAATYSTLSTAKGPWTDPANWDGGYPGCCVLTGPGAQGHTYIIRGFITVGTTSVPQNLEVDKGILHVEDTLIIYGNLTLGNNADLYLASGSVLMVYGNVTIANQVDISANSYFIIMGDFTKTGAENQGSFTSDDQPSNVYIGGTITVPGNWAQTGDNDVLNCDLPEEHENSECNYGNPIDLQDSPIADFINELCAHTPEITSLSSNSPVVIGGTINLSANGNPGTGSWPLTFSWTGPSGYSALGSNPSRSNAAGAMTGYYILTLINNEGCAVKDSTYVEVLTDLCCDGFSYISKDNYTGYWNETDSWATPDEPWRPLPPPVDPMNSQPLCINGYITLEGNLTIDGGTQKICDTLVITGNLNLSSFSFSLGPNGLLVVLGDFSAENGSLPNDGRIVVVGEFSSPYSSSISGSGDFYVFDDDPFIEGFVPTGDDNTLETTDPALNEFVNGLICGVGITGGIIADNQQVCQNNTAETFTSISSAGPGSGFTYQWHVSVNSSDPLSGTWAAIPGAEGLEYDPGMVGGTSWYYRNATKGAGCSANSNVLEITMYPLPIVNITAPDTACEGDVVTLDAGEGFSAYSWSFESAPLGNGQTQDVVLPSVSVPDIIRLATYSVTVTDANNCIASAVHDIVVFRIPVTEPVYQLNPLYGY